MSIRWRPLVAAVAMVLALAGGAARHPAPPPLHAATGAPKSRPILSYTEFGVFFCEARGAIDLLMYHDGTVLSTLQAPYGGDMQRDYTRVHEYHFPRSRVLGIMRQLKRFGIFDTPSAGHDQPTDDNVVLLDARFEGKRAVSPYVYIPDEAEPVGRANVFLRALVSRLSPDAPLYRPHGFSVKVSRANDSWRFGTPWPARDQVDLRRYVGEHVVVVDTGAVFESVLDPFLYEVYQQDLRPACDERACKRAFFVYWRPLWPHEPGP